MLTYLFNRVVKEYCIYVCCFLAFNRLKFLVLDKLHIVGTC